MLSYSSTNRKQDNTWRNIKVQVRKGKYDIRARRGYRAPRTAARGEVTMQIQPGAGIDDGRRRWCCCRPAAAAAAAAQQPASDRAAAHVPQRRRARHHRRRRRRPAGHAAARPRAGRLHRDRRRRSRGASSPPSSSTLGGAQADPRTLARTPRRSAPTRAAASAACSCSSSIRARSNRAARATSPGPRRGSSRRLTFADRSALMLMPVGQNVGFTWAHDRVQDALQRVTGHGTALIQRGNTAASRRRATSPIAT